MAKLTLTVDDELLERVRMRAVRLETTVEALVRDHLAGLAGENATRQALSEFLEFTDQISASSAPNGHDWSREGLRELLDGHIERHGEFNGGKMTKAREVLYRSESGQENS